MVRVKIQFDCMSASAAKVTCCTTLQGTPIGNLEDMGFRAIRILQNVNLILAEDTRHTRKLLDHYDIHTPTLSCHEHNERQRQELVLRRLQQGEVGGNIWLTHRRSACALLPWHGVWLWLWLCVSHDAASKCLFSRRLSSRPLPLNMLAIVVLLLLLLLPLLGCLACSPLRLSVTQACQPSQTRVPSLWLQLWQQASRWCLCQGRVQL